MATKTYDYQRSLLDLGFNVTVTRLPGGRLRLESEEDGVAECTWQRLRGLIRRLEADDSDVWSGDHWPEEFFGAFDWEGP